MMENNGAYQAERYILFYVCWNELLVLILLFLLSLNSGVEGDFCIFMELVVCFVMYGIP